MVFSQTSLNTRNILKVVELDRLTSEKSPPINGRTGGVVIDGTPISIASPTATSSFTEVILKSEPLHESTMFHDSDYEFFQDLQWFFAPAKEEHLQTIDSSKKTEEGALQIDTLHTPYSPQGWETFDANSPNNPAGFYNTTPIKPLSPIIENLPSENQSINTIEIESDNNTQFQEKFLDLNSLPVVIGDLTSQKVTDQVPWPNTEPIDWSYTHDIGYNHTNTNTYTQPFFDPDEDSLDMKHVSVIPRELDSNNVVITEYIINNDDRDDGRTVQNTPLQRRGEGLSVDVSACAPHWTNDAISTPEVLSYVEQLEKEKYSYNVKSQPKLSPDISPATSHEPFTSEPPSPLKCEPITPKSESRVESDDDVIITSSRKRRHDSEDSDETYTPHSEAPARKLGRRRKPSVPIKDMILALEGSQTQSPVRRGRPPKRRESTVSSVCSVDDSSSISTQEHKYRELRDKNNEASKRSRMNRKLKELQMEQLCVDLEEKNKNLRIRADILENMTKRLKNELMTAILNK